MSLHRFRPMVVDRVRRAKGDRKDGLRMFGGWSCSNFLFDFRCSTCRQNKTTAKNSVTGRKIEVTRVGEKGKNVLDDQNWRNAHRMVTGCFAADRISNIVGRQGHILIPVTTVHGCFVFSWFFFCSWFFYSLIAFVSRSWHWTWKSRKFSPMTICVCLFFLFLFETKKNKNLNTHTEDEWTLEFPAIA